MARRVTKLVRARAANQLSSSRRPVVGGSDLCRSDEDTHAKTLFAMFALLAMQYASSAIAAPATCTAPGLWQVQPEANMPYTTASVTPSLTGSLKLPWCSAPHNLVLTLVGTSGFNVDAQYQGTDCQGYTESLSYSNKCQTASGTWRNNDGNAAGTDTWTRTATITLARESLTTINATAAPSGGVFNFTTTLSSGSNGATVAQANGYSTSSNPDKIQLTAPGGGGPPSPGGLETLVATYTVDGAVAKNDLNTIATFGMSCYMVALESDYGTPPNSCSSTTISGVTYSGAVTNPYGLTGTYCSSFIANVKLQGTGQLNSGSYIHYNTSTGQMDSVTSVIGADGTAVIAGGSVARDRAIIPGRGVLVDVDGVGNGLLANDTGGKILGYRLDLFNGAGKAVCANYPNPHGVGVCQTPQGTTCPGSALK